MNQASRLPPTAGTAADPQELHMPLPRAAILTFAPAGPKPVRKTVKRLIRHRATRQYFRNGGGWTADPLEATVFVDCLDALQACIRHGLTDVELALRIGSGTCDFFSTPMR